MTPTLETRLEVVQRSISSAVLAELQPAGYWTGELSSSALSTATAVIALSAAQPQANGPFVRAGLRWLAAHANSDGGWGDTVRSTSNLSTTALVWAAFGAAQADLEYPATVDGATAYLTRAAGSLSNLIPTIEARYGKDRTFSIPIVMTLALSGRLGPEGWKQVRPLPFELAAVPRSLLGILRLPVVSYALPALIAIGQVIDYHVPRLNPLRALTRKRTLDLLTTLQPSNGGFLEATPLTSFVTMSLAAMGLSDHIVARRGCEFLKNSARADGSWPIDSNLGTWVTTMAIKALRHQPAALSADQKSALRGWLLQQQYKVRHAYTLAAPGGWAWTDLPGGVPDADDTAGALLALQALQGENDPPDPALLNAVMRGVNWLLGLQNGDGGIPTFCRGWGTLPFDRSTPELTAHALRAWSAWLSVLAPTQQCIVRRATRAALRFLARSQRPDGSWVPLWFGNESEPAHENPTYGTAQVLLALKDISSAGFGLDLARVASAQQWLLHTQHHSGGWGGGAGINPTVEETALALAALATVKNAQSAVVRGATWLTNSWSAESPPAAAPIGLYFAQLWYYERLYPFLFSLEALGRLLRPCPQN